MAREVAISFALGASLKSGFTAAFQGAAQQSRNLGQAIREMERTPVGRIGADMQAQREKIRGLGTALRAARGDLEGLRQKAAETGSASGILARQIVQAEKRVEGLSGAVTRQNAAWRETVARAASVGGSVRGLGADYERLSAKMERARKVQIALEANRTRGSELAAQRADLHGRLLGVGAQAATVALPVKMAIDWESSLADVKKVTNFDDAGFKVFSKDLLDMSTRLPIAAEGLAEIAAAAGAAGIKESELLVFAEDAAKMGVAFDISAREAGAAMTGLRNNFKLSQDEMRLLGDAMNALSNSMDAKAAGLVDFANRAGGTATIYKFTGQEVSALGAAFLDAKVGVEQAATATNAMLVRLGTADSLSDDAQEAFASLGLSGKGMAKAFREDAQGALLHFLQTVSKSEDPMRALSAIFGAEHAPKIAKLVTGLDRYGMALDTISDAKNYQGSLEDEYAARADTAANKLQLLGNSASRLGRIAGSTLLPVVSGIAESLTGVITGIGDLANRFPRLAGVVMGAAAAIAGLAAGGLVLGLVFNAARTSALGWRQVLLKLAASQVTAAATTGGLSAAGLAFGAAGKAAGIGARFFAGGLRSILVSTGVGALLVGLGYGVMLLVKNWDQVSAAMGRAWAWVTETWSRLGVFFSLLGGEISSALQPAVNWLSSAFVTCRDWVLGAWTGVTEFFSGIWQSIVNGAALVWENVVGWACEAWEKIAGIWSGASSFFSGIVDGIAGVFNRLFDWLRDNFSWLFNAIDVVGGFVGKVTGAVGRAWEGAFGKNSAKPEARAPSSGEEKKPSPAPAATAALKRPIIASEKPTMPSGAGGKKIRGLSGGGGGRGSGSGGRSGGPVTVVTLDGGAASTHTLFIPASAGASGAPSRGTGLPGTPQLPLTPSLVGRNAARRGKAAGPPGAISVEVNQDFGIMAQDPRAVRAVLTSIKPDVEALVRGALEKIASDKRRTAYAQ